MGSRHYIDRKPPDQDGAAKAGAGPGLQREADIDADDEPLEGPAVSVINFVVGAEHGGWRLDRVAAAHEPGFSRSRLQAWIEQGAARVNGRPARVRDTVFEGDEVSIESLPIPEHTVDRPETMPLAIVHEDDAIIVLDKPPGLVVHPGAGNWTGTLLNGLLAHDASLAGVPRAGIVHRLDAGTSGLMVVAKSAPVQLELARQLQAREVTREYWALVTGVTPAALTIDASLSRDPRNPLRFRVGERAGARAARTHMRRIDSRARASSPVGAAVSWVACRLDTGRTHQIRVHLESAGHPLIGDPIYSKGRPAVKLVLSRQALHACRLILVHPLHGRLMSWFRSPPADLEEAMRRTGFDPSRQIDVFDEKPAR